MVQSEVQKILSFLGVLNEVPIAMLIEKKCVNITATPKYSEKYQNTALIFLP